MRINDKYAYKSYIANVKARLNITIDENLLKAAKRFAEKNGISLSQMIETYLRSLNRPARDKDIFQLIHNLPKPRIEIPEDINEAYYEEKKKKYGF